jgi:hypothetical protein
MALIPYQKKLEVLASGTYKTWTKHYSGNGCGWYKWLVERQSNNTTATHQAMTAK